QTWNWKGLPICYKTEGKTGPAVVLIHGFGASWGHWRKNIPTLATQSQVYALDHLGIGGSAKPLPTETIGYRFETWGQQIVDFCLEIVVEPAFLVGNSIGCIAAMQAAVIDPEIAIQLALLNCSLRLLHERKRSEIPWYRGVGTDIAQAVLRQRWVSQFFFKQVATPGNVRKVLLQAYHQPEAVTDELVEMLLIPSKEPTAVDVFMAFTGYSQGPLPEDLLPILPCPAIILWGAADPWEPIEMGRAFADYEPVKQFIPLEGVGHCPQDEAPELVNSILLEWIESALASL
ncbi:MAG: alpha/beta fold hydrolase, partial [Microcoleaceae cyanobacterium]